MRSGRARRPGHGVWLSDCRRCQHLPAKAPAMALVALSGYCPPLPGLGLRCWHCSGGSPTATIQLPSALQPLGTLNNPQQPSSTIYNPLQPPTILRGSHRPSATLTNHQPSTTVHTTESHRRRERGVSRSIHLRTYGGLRDCAKKLRSSFKALYRYRHVQTPKWLPCPVLRHLVAVCHSIQYHKIQCGSIRYDAVLAPPWPFGRGREGAVKHVRLCSYPTIKKHWNRPGSAQHWS